jgi:hypothetical protein
VQKINNNKIGCGYCVYVLQNKTDEAIKLLVENKIKIKGRFLKTD